jgi:ATP-grasp domain, R2K clade family 3
MKTQWIVENFTRESSYLDLVKAIKKEGNPLQEIKTGFAFADVAKYDASAPVIFCGSIEMTELVKSRLPKCFPVAYCNQEKYLCSKYMSHFGKYLFNDNYVMVPLTELHRQKFYFYGLFGKETMIFVRPDSGQKPFQARLVDLQDFDEFYSGNEYCKHELVVISSPKMIRGEWRFVVSKHKEIIAMSTYRYQGKITRIPSAPPKATELVKEMLEIGYYPDSVFVMDVCEDSDGSYWLLELNSFSSSGLYECNKEWIVRKISAIAEQEWSEWHKNLSV